MAEKIYQAWNGPAPTIAAQASVSTGNVVKTMQQIATLSTVGIYIIEWGFSFNGSAVAAGIEVELFDTSVAATGGTAYNAVDIMKYSEPTGRATTVTLGTGASGFSFSTEGTPATVHMIDAVYNQPTNYYYKQYPAGREPTVDVSRFLRLRVTAASAVNMLSWITWGE